VPRGVLKDGRAIRFDYTFQKGLDEMRVEDYGPEIVLRFGAADLPPDK
jgi:hypothetical protein